ncbi:MAG: murein biosynthesis integral membrane protein MurJ [Bdellovibrionaceae bacterium]|nr:murein biosynthesis integral membrane protein MurJ [Pseudobdellovibrionaceae bacterium]
MAPGDSSKEVRKNVTLQALSMSAGTFSSRILGLLRDMALAALFSREVTDAWTAAFRLPNLFRRLLGEGSLSVSFIPVFVEARVDSPERAQNLANGFYTLLLLFLTVLTTAGIVFVEPLMRLMLSSNYEPEKLALTVRMARIMFGFVFFISVYAYFMGILNAYGKFALPAMAPMLFNVAMIVSTVLPGTWFPFVGDGLAWGVLAGGALQMAILVPALVRLKAMPRGVDFRGNADVGRILRNMLPGLLGMGLLQFTTIVNLKYASGLGDGAISYIYWADRLLELPLSLVAVSLGAALLPSLSGMWARGERARMASTANYYLRLNLFIAVPAALGLYVLALPIVEVLFMRGRFTMQDAEATAAVLRIYAVLLIFASAVRVLVPSYYAIKNTWFPAVVACVALIMHMTLAPLMMAQWGLQGLVASSAASAALNIILLLACYRKFVGSFDYAKLFVHLSKFVGAGALMALVLQGHGVLANIVGNGYIAKVGILALTIAIGTVVYAVASKLLGVEELVALSRKTKRLDESSR